MEMVKSLPASLKWLLFTFFSSTAAYFLPGISAITIAVFSTGLLFSIAYFYREHL